MKSRHPISILSYETSSRIALHQLQGLAELFLLPKQIPTTFNTLQIYLSGNITGDGGCHSGEEAALCQQCVNILYDMELRERASRVAGTYGIKARCS